jgi:hypothetical protein
VAAARGESERVGAAARARRRVAARIEQRTHDAGVSSSRRALKRRARRSVERLRARSRAQQGRDGIPRAGAGRAMERRSPARILGVDLRVAREQRRQ